MSVVGYRLPVSISWMLVGLSAWVLEQQLRPTYPLAVCRAASAAFVVDLGRTGWSEWVVVLSRTHLIWIQVG